MRLTATRFPAVRQTGSSRHPVAWSERADVRDPRSTENSHWPNSTGYRPHWCSTQRSQPQKCSIPLEQTFWDNIVRLNSAGHKCPLAPSSSRMDSSACSFLWFLRLINSLHFVKQPTTKRSKLLVKLHHYPNENPRPNDQRESVTGALTAGHLRFPRVT